MKKFNCCSDRYCFVIQYLANNIHLSKIKTFYKIHANYLKNISFNVREKNIGEIKKH